MSEMEFLGYLITGLGALSALIASILKLIVSPINALNISVTKLNTTLDQLNLDTTRLEDHIKCHDGRLDDIELALVRQNIL